MAMPEFSAITAAQALPSSPTQWTVRVAGQCQGLFFNVSANTVTVSSTFLFRRNGANGNQAVTIGTGLTGIFQDTTHSDTIAIGDAINARISSSGSGGIAANACGVTFVNPTAPTNDLVFFDGGSAIVNNQFCSLLGAGLRNQASRHYITHGFAVNTSQLAVFVALNSLNAAATLAILKNGLTGSQNIAVGAGLTGWFTDNAHSDIFQPTDLLCLGWTTSATSGSAGVYGKALVETQLFTASGAASAAASTSASGIAAGRGVGNAPAQANVSAIGIAAAVGAGLAACLSVASAAGLALGVGAGLAAGLAVVVAAGISVAVGAGFAGAAVSFASAMARSFATSAGNALGAAFGSAAGEAIGWLRMGGATAGWPLQSGQSAAWTPESGQSATWTPQNGDEPVAP